MTIRRLFFDSVRFFARLVVGTTKRKGRINHRRSILQIICSRLLVAVLLVQSSLKLIDIPRNEIYFYCNYYMDYRLVLSNCA